MNGSPLLLSFALLWTSFVFADDSGLVPVSSEYQKDDDSPTDSAFAVRSYPTGADKDDSRIDTGSSDQLHGKRNALVVDYYPFDSSGFRVSAGAIAPEQKNLGDAYASGEGSTYLGVGWKARVGEAQRLDLSVELGTFIGSETSGKSYSARPATDIESTASNPDSADKSVNNPQPVISFGINYRF